MGKIYYSKVLHVQGRFMMRRLLYFTKNATIVGDSSRNWQICLSTSNSWSKRFLVVEYLVTEIPTRDIPIFNAHMKFGIKESCTQCVVLNENNMSQ